MSNMYTRCIERKQRQWAIVWKCSDTWSGAIPEDTSRASIVYHVGDDWQGTLPLTASEAIREFVIAHSMGVRVRMVKLVGERREWYKKHVRDGGWSLLASRRVWSA